MRVLDFVMQVGLAALAVFASIGAVLMVPPANQFHGARVCFWVAAIIVMGEAAMFSAQWAQSFWLRALLCSIVASGATVSLMAMLAHLRTAEIASKQQREDAFVPGKGAEVQRSKVSVLGYVLRPVTPKVAAAPITQYEVVLNIKNIGQIACDQPFWSGSLDLSPGDITTSGAAQLLERVQSAWNGNLPIRGLAEIEPGQEMSTHDNMKLSAENAGAILSGRMKLHVSAIMRYADANTPPGRYWVTQFVGSSSGTDPSRIQILVNQTFLGP